MMAIQLRKEMCEKLEEALADPRNDDNNFVREGGKTFMLHDEIRVRQQSPGRVSVEFFRRGKKLLQQIIEIDSAAAGNTGAFSTVDGRTLVKFF